MRDAPSRSSSSTTDSAASETAPQLAQPVNTQPGTSAPAVPAASADPSEAERARGTELYKHGDWQVHACFSCAWFDEEKVLCSLKKESAQLAWQTALTLSHSALCMLQLLQSAIVHC